MILNSKQLEELENIQDASGEFEEEAGDSDGYVEGVENALAWRRGMVERAVINIRKLLRKPMESVDGVTKGSLLYLKESKRFVRVHENQDGRNELSFVGLVPSLTPIKPEKPAKAEKLSKSERPAKTPKPAKAEKPIETKVAAKVAVKAIDAKPQAAPAKLAKANTPKAAKKPAPAENKKAEPKKAESKKEKPKSKLKASVSKKTPAAKSSTEKVTKKVALKPSKKPAKAVAKPKLKKTSTKKVVQKSKPKATAKKNVAKKLPKKSASKYMTDPVADPNGYIRTNFRLMSNKELSHITGLSEHTIRRKLGEWGLKRI